MIKNLLLIDDDDTTLKLLTLMVIRNGFAEHVFTLKNGKEGLDYFDQLTSRERGVVPDMIFLDIEMPVMNGWDFLDEYLMHYKHLFPDVQISMCSSSFLPADMMKAAHYPAVITYIQKPLVLPELDRLKEHEAIRKYFTHTTV